MALCNNFDSIINNLGLDMQVFSRYRASKCPIHDGDNPTALTIYPDTEPYGYWICNTKGCHRHFTRNAIGFIWGVLSARNGWNSKNKEKMPFGEVLDVCKGFVGHIDMPKVDLRGKLMSEIRLKKEIKTGVGRDKIRANLIIPAEYFLKPENGGFKPETLDFFDIGLPKKPKEMYNRVIVPIYDENFLYLGCQGRAINQDPIRWKNSESLNGILGDILYNYHLAKASIRETKEIVLVESPKSVWRLWESGVRNVVGTLGPFKGSQQILLEMSGCSKIRTMFDNDESGEAFHQSVVQKCKRLFHIEKIQYGEQNSDPANLQVEEVKHVFNI